MPVITPGQLPVLLDQYGLRGKIQFVQVQVIWNRNLEVHRTSRCVVEELGTEDHW